MVAEMLACTEDCFHTMFIIHAPGVFIRTKMDYYVLSSLMKAFRNVLTIIEHKTQVPVLRTHSAFPIHHLLASEHGNAPVGGRGHATIM